MTYSVGLEATAEQFWVLIVEADPSTSAIYGAAIEAAGMHASSVSTVEAADAAFEMLHPGMVLIGYPLPDSHEFELVRHFASFGECGVIVLAGGWALSAAVKGLEAGADDFIAKPAVADNVVARIRAVRRRLQRSPPPPAAARPEKPADHDAPVITVDATHRCLVGPTGERTLLTEAELSALETLLDAKGASVSREWLGRVALRRLIRVDDRSVDQLVMKLRRKLCTQGVSERAILSARRQGYVIPDPALFRANPATHAGEHEADHPDEDAASTESSTLPGGARSGELTMQ